METILGIDLGTTNSEVAIIRNGQHYVLPDDDGQPILPSVVGLDAQGKLIVGRAARNQFVLAPERTVISIKRKMGEETRVNLGDQQYTPQEISAMILRTLKQRAEKALGHEVKKAVITVPAFFNEAQRAATREAGELAGLDVVRIINEPTAAVLTYDPHPPEMQRLLVYDLGGGTFDVSIAQVEAGVVEILASHGDTHLGGDDFDQRLLDHVADRFLSEHGIDLRDTPISRSRLLRAVEDAKKALSFEAVVQIEEEFIAEKKGLPLNLKLEVVRAEYEALIEPLLVKTLSCLDQAMEDAQLTANQIQKVVLVGGATRTPFIHRLLQERLGRPVHSEIEPDLAVAMGAAVQGALIAGIDVGPVLVDITPHTLGIEALGEIDGMLTPFYRAPVIERNTPLPATRTESFGTISDGQDQAQIRVFQGESEDTRDDVLVGQFKIEGLAKVEAGNQILIKLALDLNGMLNVTATERLTGLSRHVTIENALERFRTTERTDAIDRLDALFGTPEDEQFEDQEYGDDEDRILPPSAYQVLGAVASEEANGTPEQRQAVQFGQSLISKAEQCLPEANPEDASELKALLTDLRKAVEKRATAEIHKIGTEVGDILFYMKDN